MESIAFQADYQYIKDLAAQAREQGYHVKLDNKMGVFLVLTIPHGGTEEPTEVFRGMKINARWSLRGNPRFYEKVKE